MKGILDLLARAKLIELTEDEQRTAHQGASAAPATAVCEPAPPSSAAVPGPAPGAGEVAEGRALEDIFADAGLGACAFPAEKLLRLLDGLRAMDVTTRKAAVLAMDAADDNWQIADCVADAQHKMAALETYKQHLVAQLRGSEQQTSAQIADIRARLEQASAAIRQQISELEQLLEREVAKAAQQTTTLEAEMRAARATAAREARRVDEQIVRLREIPEYFTAGRAAD